MDLRIEKTKKNIMDAFIELRRKKPLEKITVKELSELARINKSTFYRHYEDIYALSEEIEDGIIQNCLNMIPDPDRILEEDSIYLLAEALSSQKDLYQVIFSGSRKDIAISKLHDRIMEKILARHPEYQNNIEKQIMLTTLIYGTSRAYLVYSDIDKETLIRCLIKLNHALHQ